MPAMTNPETKRLNGAELFVRVDDGGRSLQVHIIRGPNEPPVKYAEITVRAFDETKAEIAVARVMPRQETFMGSLQSTGFYLLALKEGHRVASVEVARGAGKQTFEIAPEMVGQPIKLPMLQGRDTFADIYYEGETIGISVLIFRKPGDPDISYSEVKLRAFDETGAEVPVAQAELEKRVFSGPANNRGKYLLGLKEGQRVVSVEVTRGGEKQTFAVTHERNKKARQ